MFDPLIAFALFVLLVFIALVYSYVKYNGAVKESIKLKAQLNEAVHLATHDSLTGLPNRLLFHDRLEQAIINADREQKLTALLYMDLNKFKPVNDRMGHSAGDDLLQMVSDRLRHTVRKTDTIARLGGDEFAVILFEINSVRSAVDIAKKILKSFDEPYMIQGHPIYIGTSIGIAVYPDDAITAPVLIDCADIAMYEAKESGSGYALCHK